MKHNISDMNCVYESICIGKQCSLYIVQGIHNIDAVAAAITTVTAAVSCVIFIQLFIFFWIRFNTGNFFLLCARTNIDYSIEFCVVATKMDFMDILSWNKGSLLAEPTPK